MTYHVEYLRPDGWWHLISYDDELTATRQMAFQLEHYPGAAYRVRSEDEPVGDLAHEDLREDDPTIVRDAVE